MPTDAPGPVPFPDIGANRTLSEAATELAEHVGNPDEGDLVNRAIRSYQAAVREFNDRPWRFNRRTQDITLTATDTFDLNTGFRDPLRAVLLNAAGAEIESIDYLPYRLFFDAYQNRSTTASMPQLYTAFNTHRLGKVVVYPKLATPLSYPTLRLLYHQWIDIPAVGTDRVGCPRDVEEAIFELALAKLVHKEKGSSRAATEYTLAGSRRVFVWAGWGDFADYRPGASE